MKLLKLTIWPDKPPHFIKPDGLESWRKDYWEPVAIEEVEACGYDLGAGWNPDKCGHPEPCPDHADRRCFCGARALLACPDASGQFVCGQPTCEEHRWCDRHGGREYALRRRNDVLESESAELQRRLKDLDG